MDYLICHPVFFGAGKLPQVGSALGKSLRSVRQGLNDKLDKEENGKSARKDPGIESWSVADKKQIKRWSLKTGKRAGSSEKEESEDL